MASAEAPDVTTRGLLQLKRAACLAQAVQTAEAAVVRRLEARSSLEIRAAKTAAYERALVEWRDGNAHVELKRELLQAEAEGDRAPSSAVGRWPSIRVVSSNPLTPAPLYSMCMCQGSHH